MSLLGKTKIVATLLIALSVAFLFSIEQGQAADQIIGRGDILEVTIWSEPDLSGKQRVNDSGEIQKAWLPAVVVEGLNVEKATEAYQKMLKTFFKEPKVKISIVESSSRSVSLVGSFGAPGEYRLGEDETLLRVLLKAGGVKVGSAEQGYIIRMVEDEVTRIPVKVKALLTSNDRALDYNLKPGDVVYLPYREATQGEDNYQVEDAIVVTGAVNKMGSFPFRDGYSALNAIIDAGGFSKFAAPGKARIVRGKGDKEKIIKVDLDAVVNRGDKTKNVSLEPGDIIVVPESLF